MAMTETGLAAPAPREDVNIASLRRALAAGGVSLVAGPHADEASERLLAEPRDLRLGALSEHAGGQGHLSAWVCLAFGMTPFDLEPQEARLATFAAACGPVALIVAEAERFSDAELLSLAAIAERTGLALLLLGSARLAERARGPALVNLRAQAAPAPSQHTERAEARAPRITAPGRDAFAVIAAAAARPSDRFPEKPPVATTGRRRRGFALAGAGFAFTAALLAIGSTALFGPGAGPEPAAFYAAPVLSNGDAEAPPAVALTSDDPAPMLAATYPAAPASSSRPVVFGAPPRASARTAASPRLAAADSAPRPSVADRAMTARAAPARLAPPARPAGFAAPQVPAAEIAEAPSPRPRPAIVAPVAPPGSAPWIVIHHAPESRALAESLRVALGGGDFRDVALREIGFDVSADHIRYYFAEDQGLARRLSEALAEAAGGGFAVRDFTAFERLPGRMTLEVWLAGGA